MNNWPLQTLFPVMLKNLLGAQGAVCNSIAKEKNINSLMISFILTHWNANFYNIWEIADDQQLDLQILKILCSRAIYCLRARTEESFKRRANSLKHYLACVLFLIWFYSWSRWLIETDTEWTTKRLNKRFSRCLGLTFSITFCL